MIKTFEDYNQDLDKFQSKWEYYEKIIENCGYYIESQLPQKDYFDWEFTNEDTPIIRYEFYYDLDIDDEQTQNVFDTFEKLKLECLDTEIGTHFKSKEDMLRFIVDIPAAEAVKIGKDYEEITKYNL